MSKFGHYPAHDAVRHPPLRPSLFSQDLGPDLRQAADDLFQAKESFQAAREETGGLWSDMQRAVSGAVEGVINPDGGPEQQGNVALEWELLKRDTAKAAKEVLGEVKRCLGRGRVRRLLCIMPEMDMVLSCMLYAWVRETMPQ